MSIRNCFDIRLKNKHRRENRLLERVTLSLANGQPWTMAAETFEVNYHDTRGMMSGVNNRKTSSEDMLVAISYLVDRSEKKGLRNGTDSETLIAACMAVCIHENICEIKFNGEDEQSKKIKALVDEMGLILDGINT